MDLVLFYTIVISLLISLSFCDPNYGKYLVGNTMKVIEIIGRKGCRKECVSVTSCLSYNFDRISLTCELKTDNATTGQLISRKSSSYEEKNDFTQENYDPCSTANCPEFSKCVPLKKGSIKCIQHECRSAPPMIANAIRSPNGTHFLIGTNATYTCKEGSTLTGIPEVTCKANMNWSTAGFQCSVDCGNPPTVAGATVDSGATTYNAQRTYTCNDGYNSNGGSGNTQCSSSGSWSTISLICTIKDCGTPPTIANAAISTGSTTAGSTRTYICNTGTTASGSPATIACQNSGNWQTTTFSCTVADCQNALVVFGAVVTGTGSNIGSTRTVTCDVAYQQTVGSGPATSTCQGNGQWSTPNINCSQCSNFGSTFTLRQNKYFNPPVSFTPSVSGGSVNAAYCKNACLGRSDFVCVAAYYRKSPAGYCVMRHQRIHDKPTYPQHYKTNNAFDEYIRNCA